MHARKGRWITAAASMLAVVAAAFALPVLNATSGDPSTSLETAVPPASPSPSNGTESVVPSPTAKNATAAEELPTERAAVPEETGITPVGKPHNSTGKLATGAPPPHVEPAAVGTTTATFQSVGVGQANSETLISQAMAALETLRQLASGLPASQPSAISAPPSINSINNIPADSSGTQTIHNVTIGDGSTRFTPAIIKARPGETITFTWVGKNNHSVTESDQLGSCTKSVLPTAFDSGVQEPGTVWNLTLPANARGLKFFYCKVAMHCAKTGMSGVIITPE